MNWLCRLGLHNWHRAYPENALPGEEGAFARAHPELLTTTTRVCRSCGRRQNRPLR